MAEYHIGCGAFGIYAGTLNSKNKNLWQNKTECTDEAICAVRDYMYGEFIKANKTTGGWKWDTKDGKVVELRISVKEKERDKNA